MYGTIARMKTKPGAMELLKKLEMRRPKGFLGSYVYQMDADPNELWMVVMFESKQAYMENADSPEQNEEYLQLRELLVEDPVWNDGEVVFEMKK
jgi:quinol monooxygenase YgiN